MKLFKTTIKYNGEQSPIVAIDRNEDRSLDTALIALKKYYDADLTSIKSIETKEII